jgi:CRP-like cAMP-binding protein
MLEIPRPPNKNRILAALPPEEYERIAPHLETLPLHHGQILYETDGRINDVYFPINAMISLVSEMSDGTSVEVGVTGFEGMTGLAVMLGVERSAHATMAQIEGDVIRVKAEVIKSEFKRGGVLQELLLRYAQSLWVMTSQVAACNRVHSVGERLARWLLMSYDRCVCEDLPLTHEFIAMMLGTRRAGVTEAAIILQAEGLIHYKRGHITIIDKEALEHFACECYEIVKKEFNSLLETQPCAAHQR